MKKPLLKEKETVSRILLGNEKALRLFYKTYSRSLSSFVKAKIENSDDAAEVIQDTFLAALESLRDFSFKSSLFTYICSIGNHKVIDYYRRKKIKHIVFSKIQDVESLLGTLLGPEDAFDKELLKLRIKETFKKITPAYSRIIKLKYIQGYSVEEIAEQLCVSFTSAESQLFRARKAFVAAYQP